MAVSAVVFDVGETLIDETRNWEAVADACDVTRFTLMALVGAAIARGESSHVDFVSSSERWGVEKPSAAFFDCVIEAGDARDVVPALAAGRVAVHIRRGPWGCLQEPPSDAIRIRSLAELPEALA
jgi:FMN phosphatase YigB (HAD superfamily)